jgi:N-acylneuraminate cytidylyltransferase
MNIAFIPVRGGSKSIPLKNIKLFCGKPLVYWSIKAACNSDFIDQVVVSTDSYEIKNIVNSFSLKNVTVYERSKENAQDNSSTEDAMLEYLVENKHQIINYFVLLQATSPFTTSQMLNQAFELCKKKDSVISGTRYKRFLWENNGTPLNYDYKNRPRRQDYEGVFLENGAFYISKAKDILKSGNRLSGNIGLFEMPEYTSIEIDEPDDWFIAEKIFEKHCLHSNYEKNISIKLFLTDIDGVMTDTGMYYSENGEELKKFNTHDGMAFELLRNSGVKTGIVTSENTKIVERRAAKLKVDYLYQGKRDGGKLGAAKEICNSLRIKLNQVAYIGDDINCFDLLSSVGLAACPANAVTQVKNIPNIIHLQKSGGNGAVREFVELIIEKNEK